MAWSVVFESYAAPPQAVSSKSCACQSKGGLKKQAKTRTCMTSIIPRFGDSPVPHIEACIRRRPERNACVRARHHDNGVLACRTAACWVGCADGASQGQQAVKLGVGDGGCGLCEHSWIQRVNHNGKTAQELRVWGTYNDTGPAAQRKQRHECVTFSKFNPHGASNSSTSMAASRAHRGPLNPTTHPPQTLCCAEPLAEPPLTG